MIPPLENDQKWIPRPVVEGGQGNDLFTGEASEPLGQGDFYLTTQTREAPVGISRDYKYARFMAGDFAIGADEAKPTLDLLTASWQTLNSDQTGSPDSVKHLLFALSEKGAQVLAEDGVGIEDPEYGLAIHEGLRIWQYLRRENYFENGLQSIQIFGSLVHLAVVSGGLPDLDDLFTRPAAVPTVQILADRNHPQFKLFEDILSASRKNRAYVTLFQWILGRHHYQGAKKLLLCADGGGSNGSRNRSWKYFVQRWADERGMEISICHYPPGTSKWNKIEHRMFSFISINWRGEPLLSYETVVNMIGGTKTRKGLHVKSRLDKNNYEKGKKISDDEMDGLNIKYHDVNPQWNYTISPRNKKREPKK